VPTLAAGRHDLRLDVEGTPREVIVQVPVVDVGTLPPAVIAFHGFTAHAWQLEETSGLSDLAAEHGFVVAYPEALGAPTEWHFAGNLEADGRDIAMVDVLMAELIEAACADPSRIVLAGHSMGGGMAADAACQLAEQVAGVALVAAVWFEAPCQPSRPVPVVAMHAVDDPVLPYGGGRLGGVGTYAPEVLPVEEAIGAWAGNDGCSGSPAISQNEDGSAILAWPACKMQVILHRLPSGGHDWPAIASGLIVDLLASTG
jgi:polyhydroxybutyrate depolymerase